MPSWHCARGHVRETVAAVTLLSDALPSCSALVTDALFVMVVALHVDVAGVVENVRMKVFCSPGVRVGILQTTSMPSSVQPFAGDGGTNVRFDGTRSRISTERAVAVPALNTSIW